MAGGGGGGGGGSSDLPPPGWKTTKLIDVVFSIVIIMTKMSIFSAVSKSSVLIR